MDGRTSFREALNRTGASGRLAVFSGFRALVPVFTLIALAASPSVHADTHRVALLLTAQVCFAAVTQGLAMRRRQIAPLALWVGIVADLVVITALLVATGGAGGPLTFLYTIEAIAAGILLSSRLGIRVLGLCTALIVGLDLAAARGYVSVPAAGLHGLLSICVLWATAGGAVLFSMFNERDLRRHAGELATIRRVTLDIEGSLAINDILGDLCRGVVEAFDFTSAAAIVKRDGAMIYTAGHGVTGQTGAAVELRGRLAETIEKGRTVVIPAEEAREDGSLADVIGARGYVAVPLHGEGLLVATRSPRSRRRRAVQSHEIDALEGLAHHAALALANARLHEHVSAMAITDPLTSLANHGEFQRRLATEVGRLERFAALKAPGHHVSLLIADIDRFKLFNDTFGHPAGDEVLRRVAEAIQVSVRSFDIAARYGGEEFAVVLPETDAEGAAVVAERIRLAVAGHTGDERQPGATLSIGVATAPENGSTPAELIEAADRALYAGKQAGRNRVTVAEGKPKMGRIVSFEPSPRRRGSASRPAPDAEQHAHAPSTRPIRRTPRA